MIVGFILWSAVSLALFSIGVWAWKSDEAVGFFSQAKAPAVRDIRDYNRRIAILWFAYALLLELFGLPFLFLAQNDASFLWVVLGVVVITIALMIGFHRVQAKFEA